jgi:heme/copper-type cytochrome/quinol oxidase subunit 2
LEREGILEKGWVAMLRWYLLAGLALVILFAPLQGSAAIPVERTFHIEAIRFQYSPAVLQVNPGDLVTIDLVSQDVVHGLSIDGYDLTITADPGQTAHLTFVANRQGSFRFRCTLTCGDMHPFMTGKLEVGQNLLFWRTAALAILALMAGALSLWK